MLTHQDYLGPPNWIGCVKEILDIYMEMGAVYLQLDPNSSLSRILQRIPRNSDLSSSRQHCIVCRCLLPVDRVTYPSA